MMKNNIHLLKQLNCIELSYISIVIAQLCTKKVAYYQNITQAGTKYWLYTKIDISYKNIEVQYNIGIKKILKYSYIG